MFLDGVSEGGIEPFELLNEKLLAVDDVTNDVETPNVVLARYDIGVSGRRVHQVLREGRGRLSMRAGKAIKCRILARGPISGGGQ